MEISIHNPPRWLVSEVCFLMDADHVPLYGGLVKLRAAASVLRLGYNPVANWYGLVWSSLFGNWWIEGSLSMVLCLVQCRMRNRSAKNELHFIMVNGCFHGSNTNSVKHSDG